MRKFHIAFILIFSLYLSIAFIPTLEAAPTAKGTAHQNKAAITVSSPKGKSTSDKKTEKSDKKENSKEKKKKDSTSSSKTNATKVTDKKIDPKKKNKPENNNKKSKINNILTTAANNALQSAQPVQTGSKTMPIATQEVEEKNKNSTSDNNLEIVVDDKSKGEGFQLIQNSSLDYTEYDCMYLKISGIVLITLGIIGVAFFLYLFMAKRKADEKNSQVKVYKSNYKGKHFK